MEEFFRTICMNKENQRLSKQPGLWPFLAQNYLIWEAVF